MFLFFLFFCFFFLVFVFVFVLVLVLVLFLVRVLVFVFLLGSFLGPSCDVATLGIGTLGRFGALRRWLGRRWHFIADFIQRSHK
mgnify:FL=1